MRTLKSRIGGGVYVHGKLDPYIAVIHGGPGAAGELRYLAGELADRQIGVLEPIQSADSLDGQVEELYQQLMDCSRTQLILLGHSWGAMLALLTAARYPEITMGVTLVGSALFDPSFAESVLETRLSRLSPEEQNELQHILDLISGKTKATLTALEDELYIKRLRQLFHKCDSYDPEPDGSLDFKFQMDIYQQVWADALRLRNSGELLARVSQYKGRVFAIHGDYDPHPSAGVRDPLKRVLSQFEFIELPRCGHSPWIERQAKDAFYQIIEALAGKGGA